MIVAVHQGDYDPAIASIAQRHKVVHGSACVCVCVCVCVCLFLSLALYLCLLLVLQASRCVTSAM